MRRKTVILLAAALMCVLAGCADRDQSREDQTTDLSSNEGQGMAAGASQPEHDATAEGADDSRASSLENHEIIPVSMGTFCDGEQQEYCTVALPADYQFAASYTDENDVERSFVETGAVSLQEAKEEGILDAIQSGEEEISYLWLHSLDLEENFYFAVSASEADTLTAIKAYEDSGTDFGTAEHPAYWYTDEGNEYSAADIMIGYQINDSVTLNISYSGPLTDELGLDQLARELYSMVTVNE